MALSDHERKLLAEMEAALEQEDPRLLSTLTGKAPVSYTHLTLPTICSV